MQHAWDNEYKPMQNSQSLPGSTDHGASMNAILFKKSTHSNLDELQTYLAEPLYEGQEDAFTVWRTLLAPRFPNLAKMAMDYLAIPGTTVGIERVFSNGGRVASPHRCRLTPKMLDKLMTLQNWMHTLPI